MAGNKERDGASWDCYKEQGTEQILMPENMKTGGRKNKKPKLLRKEN